MLLQKISINGRFPSGFLGILCAQCNARSAMPRTNISRTARIGFKFSTVFLMNSSDRWGSEGLILILLEGDGHMWDDKNHL